MSDSPSLSLPTLSQEFIQFWQQNKENDNDNNSNNNNDDDDQYHYNSHHNSQTSNKENQPPTLTNIINTQIKLDDNVNNNDNTHTRLVNSNSAIDQYQLLSPSNTINNHYNSNTIVYTEHNIVNVEDVISLNSHPSQPQLNSHQVDQTNNDNDSNIAINDQKPVAQNDNNIETERSQYNKPLSAIDDGDDHMNDSVSSDSTASSFHPVSISQAISQQNNLVIPLAIRATTDNSNQSQQPQQIIADTDIHNETNNVSSQPVVLMRSPVSIASNPESNNNNLANIEQLVTTEKNPIIHSDTNRADHSNNTNNNNNVIETKEDSKANEVNTSNDNDKSECILTNISSPPSSFSISNSDTPCTPNNITLATITAVPMASTTTNPLLNQSIPKATSSSFTSPKPVALNNVLDILDSQAPMPFLEPETQLPDDFSTNNMPQHNINLTKNYNISHLNLLPDVPIFAEPTKSPLKPPITNIVSHNTSTHKNNDVPNLIVGSSGKVRKTLAKTINNLNNNNSPSNIANTSAHSTHNSPAPMTNNSNPLPNSSANYGNPNSNKSTRIEIEINDDDDTNHTAPNNNNNNITPFKPPTISTDIINLTNNRQDTSVSNSNNSNNGPTNSHSKSKRKQFHPTTNNIHSTPNGSSRKQYVRPIPIDILSPPVDEIIDDTHYAINNNNNHNRIPTKKAKKARLNRDSNNNNNDNNSNGNNTDSGVSPTSSVTCESVEQIGWKNKSANKQKTKQSKSIPKKQIKSTTNNGANSANNVETLSGSSENSNGNNMTIDMFYAKKSNNNKTNTNKNKNNRNNTKTNTASTNNNRKGLSIKSNSKSLRPTIPVPMNNSESVSSKTGKENIVPESVKIINPTNNVVTTAFDPNAFNYVESQVYDY